jgi:hypothetical protein
MTPAQRNAVIGLALACGMTVACQNQNNVSECDCSMFPPRQGCDQKCGIATGIVESLTAYTVTIKIPVIQATSTQEGAAVGPTESADIQLRTFTLGGVDKSQLANIKPGSRVALTYEQGPNQ